jgi:hypothetical protein
VSPPAKLCGFLVLLAVLFTAAYAVGAVLGPVTVKGGSDHGTMHMSGLRQVHVPVRSTP